jgi:hypothetical protein
MLRMHGRKAVSILLITLLSRGLFGFFHISYSASSVATLRINPSSVVDPFLQPPKNFSVQVQIANVSMLFGVEFKVFWNASLLGLAGVTFSFPWSNYYLGRSEVNGTLGRYWLSVSGVAPAVPFNGTCSLVSLEYTVKELGSTDLTIADAVMGDRNGEAIGHMIIDGFFSNGFHDVEIVRFSVWPTAVEQGDLIFINVTIENTGTYREACGLCVFADRDDGIVHEDIANQSVLLDVGECRLFEYAWNTTAVPYGSYYVTVKANLVGDVTPDDNFAQAFVGGICVPHNPSPFPLIALLFAILYGVAPIVLLGLMAYGVFVLFSKVRIRRLDLTLQKI